MSKVTTTSKVDQTLSILWDDVASLRRLLKLSPFWLARTRPLSAVKSWLWMAGGVLLVLSELASLQYCVGASFVKGCVIGEFLR